VMRRSPSESVAEAAPRGAGTSGRRRVSLCGHGWRGHDGRWAR
jgi:hypothetical protein